MAPNILLLVLDTARRDAIEPYGAPAGCTPTIAELARRGHAAEHAYATASWTLPSHVSMFTGLLPRDLGLAQPPGGTPDGARTILSRIPSKMVSSALRSAGYTTLGWSTNLWASHHAGFDIGFDQFDYIHSSRVDRVNELVAGGRRAKLAWAREGLRSDSDDGAAQAGRALRDSIANWSGRPTFWFVNLTECHSPYLPPRPWNDLGALERIRAALECERHLSFLSICLYAAGRHSISHESFERFRHLYRRAVSYMDGWLASVLEALDARGILDETLLIVTSDHGENFGEAGLIAHGFGLNQPLIHVPLVMAGPSAIQREGIFSLAELPRLLADVAGISDHPYDREVTPPGIAICQHDPMGTIEHPKVREFVEQWNVDEDGIERITAQLTCVTDGHVKLVRRGDSEVVYDLNSDPDELRPLEPSSGDSRMEALRAALHRAQTSEEVVGSAADSQLSHGASPRELAELEQQMKLLGYM